MDCFAATALAVSAENRSESVGVAVGNNSEQVADLDMNSEVAAMAENSLQRAFVAMAVKDNSVVEETAVNMRWAAEVKFVSNSLAVAAKAGRIRQVAEARRTAYTESAAAGTVASNLVEFEEKAANRVSVAVAEKLADNWSEEKVENN